MSQDESKCFFTDLPAEGINPEGRSGIFLYKITIEDKVIILKFSQNTDGWIDNIEENKEMENVKYTDGKKVIPSAIADIKHIVRSLILNGRWDVKNYDILTKKVLYNQLKYYDYPKTPEEKMNYLFKNLYDMQNYEGDVFYIKNLYNNDWRKLFFKNIDEMQFYLSTLKERGMIDLYNQVGDHSYQRCKINYNGLMYAIELASAGRESKNCFVAMSFDVEDRVIYEKGIMPILDEMGYNAIKIDNEHFESDRTINDAMIAAIKKSKFVIADFTKQKRNVYYESGYAAGREMKVIYTCKEEYFNGTNSEKKSAFDTNHYPHIIWNNIEDLKRQLKNKIEVYIKE